MATKKIPARQTPSAFPYAARYETVLGYRIHYVSEGEGEPMLFLHGNPTSSYVFRNVLGAVARRTGRRAIAMDLLGLGKSDKPQLDYSVELHASIVLGFIRQLDLRNAILVAEDWGGFLGTHAMTEEPERWASAVLMETFLWPMTWEEDADPSIVLPFKLMRSKFGDLFSRGMNMMINKVIPEHCPISEESLKYYRDSLPTYRSRKALADFPKLIPMGGQPASSQEFALGLQRALPKVTCPVLWIKADPGVIVSHLNPIGMGRLEALGRIWPQLSVRDFGPGYHFLSEENPEKVAEMVSDWTLACDRSKKLTGTDQKGTAHVYS